MRLLAYPGVSLVIETHTHYDMNLFAELDG